MALLERSSNHTRYVLSSSHLVGRSPVCALRCDNPRASAEHAVIRWTGVCWEVRDLGSSNSTFVDGTELARGRALRVEAGARIAFGDATDTFLLVDDAPPELCARASDGTMVYAEDGVLALPSADAWVFVVAQAEAPGQWLLEAADGEQRLVEDQEIVHHGAQYWWLDLPTPISRTHSARDTELRLDDIRLRFEVRDAEERVIDIILVHAGGYHRLPHRPNSDLLLCLARLRLSEAAAAALEHSEQGWIDREALLADLSASRDMLITPEQLAVEVYRARNQLRAARVVDAARLIERRSHPPCLRLGTDRIEIVDLA